MTQHALPELQPKLRLAGDRALVTVIEGRIAILLPPEIIPDVQGERIVQVVHALEAAGIGTSNGGED